jgi:hypothetical protein
LSQPPSITTGPPAPKAVERSREEDAAKEEAARRRDNETAIVTESQQAARNTPASPKLMAKKSALEDKNKSVEAQRSVGGKTFRNVGGIWFDSSYNNSQQQIMIRRGSDDYKRLDSGLRSFAENLGGTVVVVWKGKAYRIQ